MSKPASIQKILDIQPIPNAEKIEVCIVLGWKVVVKKDDNFKVGDLVVYVEIDSLLPMEEKYSFLKNTKKTEDGKEGYFLKTCKLRGQISQGLILPLSVLNSNKYSVTPMGPINTDTITKYLLNKIDENGKVDMLDYIELEEGVDVSEILGIKHYEKYLPGHLSGIAKGLFPSFIPKTDEERIQNIPEVLGELNGKSYYITTKCDGTSCTIYYREGNLGVCSRNLELKEDENNIYWKIAKKYNMLEVLGNYQGGYLAIQGEICGPGIQGNPMKLPEIDFFVFNIYDITRTRYFTYDELMEFCFMNKLKTVPIIKKSEEPFKLFDYTLEDLLEMAKGKYDGTDNDREGIVVRSLDKNISFKVLNNSYLENEK